MSLSKHIIAAMVLSSAVFAETLDFSNAVSRLLERNPDLLLARQEAAKSSADLLTAQRRPNPVLLGEYQYLDPRHRFSDVSPAATALATVHLDQPFELGGKRDKRIANVRENIVLSRLQVSDLERTKQLELIDAYFQLEQDKSLLAAAIANKEDFNKLLQIATSKFEHGFLSQIDLSKLQLSMIDYDREVSQSQNALIYDKENLAFMLSLDPAVLETTSDHLAETGPKTLDELIEHAQKNRPDCQAAVQYIKSAASALDLQNANAIPDVTVGIEYEADGPKYDPLMGVTASLPLAIFDRNKGEIEKARIDTLQAKNQHQKTMDQAAMEVRQAYATLQNRQKLYWALQQGFDSIRELKEKQEKIFALKGISVLELIDAQKTYREYQKNLTMAKADADMAALKLQLYSGLSLTHN